MVFGLAFEPDQPQAIRAAYVRLPDLTVEPAAQDYPPIWRWRSEWAGKMGEV